MLGREIPVLCCQSIHSAILPHTFLLSDMSFGGLLWKHISLKGANSSSKLLIGVQVSRPRVFTL